MYTYIFHTREHEKRENKHFLGSGVKKKLTSRV